MYLCTHVCNTKVNNNRDVFRTQSSVYDEAFLRKYLTGFSR